MDIDKIKYLYDVNENIASKYKQYFSINYDVSLIPYVETELRDFTTPMKYYIKHHDTVEYNDVLNNNINNKILYCNNDNNKIALEYIKNRPKCVMILLYDTNIKELINYVSMFSTISIINKVKSTEHGMQNLLCEIHINELLKIGRIKERLEYINDQYSYINNVTEFYAVIIEMDDYNYDEIKNSIKEKFCVSIFNNHLKIVEICSILFHSETLRFMDLRILKNWLHEDFVKTYVKLQAIKNWVNTNIPLIDRDLFIILDEGTIATLGIRNAHKFRCLINGECTVDLPFLRLYNRKHENIQNNNFYYYFNGIKIMNIHDVIDIKHNRYNLTDYMDLIAMDRIHNLDQIIIVDSDKINEKNHSNSELLSRFMIDDRMKLISLMNDYV